MGTHRAGAFTPGTAAAPKQGSGRGPGPTSPSTPPRAGHRQSPALGAQTCIVHPREAKNTLENRRPQLPEVTPSWTPSTAYFSCRLLSHLPGHRRAGIPPTPVTRLRSFAGSAGTTQLQTQVCPGLKPQILPPPQAALPQKAESPVPRASHLHIQTRLPPEPPLQLGFTWASPGLSQAPRPQHVPTRHLGLSCPSQVERLAPPRGPPACSSVHPPSSGMHRSAQ